MKHIYTSIDIGTDTIKIVVCELFNNKLNLLAASSTKSEGIKKGLITDVYEATESLKKALNEVEQMLGISIKKVIVSIPSYFSEFNMIKGTIDLNDDEEITEREVTEIMQTAAANQLASNQEMVTILPIDFSLDEQTGIKDPKGLLGSVLGLRAIMATTPKKNVYSVVSLLENVGLEVVDISFNSIGDIYALKNKEIDNQIGAIVNIGYETTTVSLYNKGIIVKNSIIGRGSKNIDHDISYIYKISLKEASRLKERFAVAHKKHASVNENYEIEDKTGNNIKINQFEISEIVMSRIEEILTLAKKEINSLTKCRVDYILITGGTSSMEAFKAIAFEVIGNIAHVGTVRLIGIRNNKYSSALGNIIYFIQKLKLKGKDYTMVSESDMETLSSNKKGLINISNDSMLGKVFGYFFND